MTGDGPDVSTCNPSNVTSLASGAAVPNRSRRIRGLPSRPGAPVGPKPVGPVSPPEPCGPVGPCVPVGPEAMTPYALKTRPVGAVPPQSSSSDAPVVGIPLGCAGVRKSIAQTSVLSASLVANLYTTAQAAVPA